ncbi:MAG: DUF5658 family protein [Pseudomonadota bacterium]|mgnify:FL=1|nr:MAG: hypothetical protein DIU56_07630 [Pseudomonadota bacterium]
MPPDRSQPAESGIPDRRTRPDRRKQTLRALFYGSRNPRRRGPRRAGDGGIASVDWHQSRWLAVALVILLLSCADAVLTLMLVSHGAEEINPVMKPLVMGSGGGFAVTKLGLTGAGVILLTLLARLRAFGRFPVGLILYMVAAGYGVLIAYELSLLDRVLVEP